MLNLRHIFTLSCLAGSSLLWSCSDGTQVLLENPTGQGAGGTSSGHGGIKVDPVLGGAGGGGVFGATCASATFEANLRPLDLYILLDQSGSMKESEDRWTPVSQAISKFIQSEEAGGINVAIQYFALGDTDEIKCDAETYATPEVEPVSLPEGAAEIEASLAAHDFPESECCTNDNEHKGTPTRPAVEGALGFLEEWLESRPDHAAALLLATDGAPTSECSDNEVEDVVEIISKAAEASTPISTYVIGIGEEESLGSLAEAGGTGEGAFLVDGSGTDTEKEFSQALETIRGRAIPCDYDFPEGGATDPALVNITYLPEGSAEPVTALFVNDASECDGAVDEWFYTYEDDQRHIQLCPRLCATVSESTQGKVDIVVGCKTRVR